MRDADVNPTKIKVLHVSTVAVTLARFLSPIARQLNASGFAVDAAAAGVAENEICQQNFEKCFEIPFERKFLSSRNLTAARTAIAEVVKQGEYDIVHVHTPIASFVTRAALRNRPKYQKLIYTAHGFHFHSGASFLQNFVFSRLEKIASPWMDHLVVINQEDKRSAKRLKIATENNLTYMSGIGVDLNEFTAPTERQQQEARSQILAELKIPETSHVFLQIAGFTKNKRHCDTLRAFAKLSNDQRQDLLFAGIGQQMEASKKLAVDLGISDRVHFLGYRTDIPKLLFASDVFLLVSQREGLPRSVMEALAVQKTVVGTSIRGTTDLIKDEVGILVPPCDLDALAKAMATSTDFRPNEKQRKAVLEACSLPRIIDQHVALYRDLVQQGSSQ